MFRFVGGGGGYVNKYFVFNYVTLYFSRYSTQSNREWTAEQKSESRKVGYFVSIVKFLNRRIHLAIYNDDRTPCFLFLPSFNFAMETISFYTLWGQHLEVKCLDWDSGLPKNRLIPYIMLNQARTLCVFINQRSRQQYSILAT